MTPDADRAAVEWLPWSGAAFARARVERRPILLSIVTAWAPGCAEMDRLSYGDPATAHAISHAVVPVRVDADQRPDIAERYLLGGLPTTAFLTPDGELLGGGTFVTAERLRAAVSKVAEAAPRLAADGGTRQGRPADPVGRPSGEGAALDDAAITELVYAGFDDRHGGFGDAPKFPLTAPVHLAIELSVEQVSSRMLEYAVRTLEAIGWGPLCDSAGGFFRCASGADWSDPQRQKLLSINASLLDLFVHAGTTLDQHRWLERARSAFDYLNGALSSADGWSVADGDDPEARFSDGNAAAVSAMLHAAAVFQDDAAGRRSLDVLERVLLSSYRPGHGVAHRPGGARGLLTDQVAMATANLDAWEATGNIVYRMMAEELMHYSLRTMWDADGGGLLDRDASADPDEPVLARAKPFVLNCEGAILLRRLAEAANDSTFARRAVEALDAMRPRTAEYGPLAAHYLIARRALLR